MCGKKGGAQKLTTGADLTTVHISCAEWVPAVQSVSLPNGSERFAIHGAAVISGTCDFAGCTSAGGALIRCQKKYEAPGVCGRAHRAHGHRLWQGL